MSAQILLDSMLARLKPNYSATLSDDDLFEQYCADTLLVNFDLDAAETDAGIVDGAKDGGIDAAYVFVNRNIVAEDSEFQKVKQPVEIELFIIQSKNQDNFKEGPLDKLSSSLPMLLDPKSDPKELAKLFNPGVVAVFGMFMKAMHELAGEFPQVTINIFYCTKADSQNLVVSAKAESLQATIKQKYPNTSVQLLGATELYERSKSQKRLVKELPTVGTPLSGINSYVALCKLPDYVKFIGDAGGALMTRIFDANVRAYQGDVEVNQEISKSLETTGSVDFWWLNNWVTIVADQAQFTNNRLVVENPLVVNGLQTSHELHRHAAVLSSDERMVLVRVIVENDQNIRDEIIRATNRQTNIKHSSFRATEPIHRDIEDYLQTVGYHYDRRKNFYKREGKPIEKIIGIDRLAQGILSVLLSQPHTARARPTTAIKADDDYSRIFSKDRTAHPLEMYGTVSKLLEIVEERFRKLRERHPQVYINNLKFHVLMVLAWTINGGRTLPALGLAKLDLSGITEEMITKVTEWVFVEFESAGAEDKTAKDAKFTERLQMSWEKSVLPALKKKSS